MEPGGSPPPVAISIRRIYENQISSDRIIFGKHLSDQIGDTDRIDIIDTDAIHVYISLDTVARAWRGKMTRAHGGCLGAGSRRRARQAAIVPGEAHTAFDPGVPEWENPAAGEPPSPS